eukprot:COSAG02_NODE_20201_length_843_cov_1.048387_1_plen_23_part_10
MGTGADATLHLAQSTGTHAGDGA